MTDQHLTLLDRLRREGTLASGVSPAAASPGIDAGTGFVTDHRGLQGLVTQAQEELLGCIRSLEEGQPPVLLEGGPYPGTWLESTATVSTEVLDRWLPEVVRATHLQLARHQRADGLLPYKVTADGPSHRQVQMVSPLARGVWAHYLRTGRDRDYLRTMAVAMARHDAWLAGHRDTRGSGCVEAFCAFDTGHDNSPRFWGVPDTTHQDDPARWDPASPVLPYLAPDLTANVACQRRYLARIAAELGEDPAPWEQAAQESEAALLRHCYDERDGCFYDRDRLGRLVTVQSDVVLRVLECGVGDRELAERLLAGFALHRRKLFARYPFTSLAMDDPRFDQDFRRNSWGGPTNFLSLLRSPHAFEQHGHVVELTWAQQPVLEALLRAGRFPQCLSPWTGEAGYTEGYSPAMLWLLDTLERLCGILPLPGGGAWVTGVPPTAAPGGLAWERIVDGSSLVMTLADGRVQVRRNGQEVAAFPAGLRLELDAAGRPVALVGMRAQPVTGTVVFAGVGQELTIAGNETVSLTDGRAAGRRHVSVIAPTP